MKKQSYSKENYRRLLKTAIENGYEFVTYRNFDDETQRREILLRHDVDLSPSMALKMARIEEDLSVTATYAILTDSFFYNALASDIIKTVDRIHALGHQVVLHYRVPLDFGKADKKTVKRVKEDILKRYQILKTVCPYTSNIFAWHNPVQGVDIERYVNFEVEGMINASWVRGYAYISDSNMRYDYDELLAFVDGRLSKLHLLLHPVYWIPEVGTVVGNMKAALTELITLQFAQLKNRTWIEHYQERMGDKPISFRSLLEFLHDQ